MAGNGVEGAAEVNHEDAKEVEVVTEQEVTQRAAGAFAAPAVLRSACDVLFFGSRAAVVAQTSNNGVLLDKILRDIYGTAMTRHSTFQLQM